MNDQRPLRVQRRRGVPRAAALVASAAAGLIATAEIASHWKTVFEHMGWPGSAGTAPMATAGSAPGANGGTVQTITGNVAQDNSRNMILYNTAFRVEVVRATDDAPDAKRELRDNILSVLDGLVGAQPQSLSGEQARALGQRLGTILDEAPISSYRLDGREFALRAGMAYYLPDGDDSVAFLGPAKDGTPDAIAIRRNGRESVMGIGAVREFRRGAQTCRLLLHEVRPNFEAAIFSYACRP